MMNDMNAIVKVLLEGSRGKAERIQAEARAEAAELVTASLETAQGECAQIRCEYEEQALEAQRRSRLNEKMEMRRMLLSAKQALVDEAVDRIRERFMAQSPEEWVTLLTAQLARADTAVGKPEIIVPRALAGAVQTAVGPEYTVTAGRMSHGFIFSFPEYDLNYEAERLFMYQKEALEREAARCLFEDDAHE